MTFAARPDASGNFIYASKYSGEFKDGRFHGKGMMHFYNGSQYEGEFRDDKFNGTGIYTFPNGNKYEGEFKDDFKHGKGTLTYANGNKYIGNSNSISSMDAGISLTPMGIPMMESFKMNSSMEKEPTPTQTEEFTQVGLKTTNVMDRGLTSMAEELNTQANL